MSSHLLVELFDVGFRKDSGGKAIRADAGGNGSFKLKNCMPFRQHARFSGKLLASVPFRLSLVELLFALVNSKIAVAVISKSGRFYNKVSFERQM